MATVGLVLLSLLLSPSLCSTVDVPSVKLMNAAKDGVMMPATGIGTGSYHKWNDDIAQKAIGEWLALGGRRVDGCVDYGDQVGIGKAIKASGLPREEIFMVSKLKPIDYNNTLQQMNQILSDLQMTYVDLLLIHTPGPPSGTATENKEARQTTWKGLEYLFNNGKARAIGVSNFEINHLQDIVDLKGLLPSVNQIEFHPYWHEYDLLAYCKKMNITFNGYSPLGAPDFGPAHRDWPHSLLKEPVVMSIAKTHSCTPAQVLQMWEWNQGVLVNPRSMNATHMKENLSFFSVQLSDQDMKAISSITPPANPKVCGDPHKVP